MTSVTTIFAGGTDGATVSGISGLTAQAGLVFDADSAMYGAMGAKNTGGTASHATIAVSGATVAFRVRFRFDSNPTSDWSIIRIQSGGTRIFTIVAPNTTRQFRTSDAAGANGTLSEACTVGVEYEIAGYVTSGSTTSNGVAKVYLYDAAGTLVSTLADSTTFKAGASVTFDTVHCLKYGSDADTVALSFGYLHVNDTTAAVPGPYTPAAETPIRPLSVLDNPGGIVIGGTGAVTHAQALSAADTSWLINPDTASDEQILLRLPPLAAGSSVAELPRMGLDTGSSATNIRCEILQGTTVITTEDFTISSTTPTTQTVSLETAEVAAITDRSNLRARITWKAT